MRQNPQTAVIQLGSRELQPHRDSRNCFLRKLFAVVLRSYLSNLSDLKLAERPFQVNITFPIFVTLLLPLTFTMTGFHIYSPVLAVGTLAEA